MWILKFTTLIVNKVKVDVTKLNNKKCDNLKCSNDKMIKVSELVQKKYSLEAEYKNKMKVVNKALEAAAKELAKEKEKSISKTIYEGYGTVLFGNKKELDKIGIELEKAKAGQLESNLNKDLSKLNSKKTVSEQQAIIKAAKAMEKTSPILVNLDTGEYRNPLESMKISSEEILMERIPYGLEYNQLKKLVVNLGSQKYGYEKTMTSNASYMGKGVFVTYDYGFNENFNSNVNDGKLLTDLSLTATETAVSWGIGKLIGAGGSAVSNINNSVTYLDEGVYLVGKNVKLPYIQTAEMVSETSGINTFSLIQNR